MFGDVVDVGAHESVKAALAGESEYIASLRRGGTGGFAFPSGG